MVEDDFLAAIAANPDDDAPRLAHADWLEQNGDADRAEFIRLHIRHAQMPFGGAEDEPAFQRQDDLLALHEQRWLAGRPAAPGLAWSFSRGYLDVVAFFTLDAFEREWRRVFEFPVQWVVFRGIRAPARLAASPGLARIRRLHLDEINEPGVLTILRSHHLGPLEGLEVHQGRLTAATLMLLATSPKFARLRELTLVGSESCSAGGFSDFLRSPHLDGLRKLGLLVWGLTAEMVRPLWERHWPALVSLNLTNNPLGPGGLAGLGDGGRFPSLEEFSISVAQLGDEGAIALARAERLTRLSRLELRHDGIGEQGVRALAEAPHLSALETLLLEGNAINDAGAEALAHSRHLSRVRSMNLNENLIGDVGMRALGRSETLIALSYLYTHDNPARPELSRQVAERFLKQLPPLPDEAPKPAVAIPPGGAIGQADEDGLVRAILADPWDELARNAYADRLEEQGKPRHAELMRLPPGNRRGKILEDLAPSILGPVSAGDDKATLLHADGLLVVRMPVKVFLSKRFERDGPDWMRQNHVNRIHLASAVQDWRRVGNAPVMRHLRGLDLTGVRLTNKGAEQLAGASGLENLASLGLRAAPLSLTGVQAIARSIHLARLCHLDLALIHPTREGVRELCEGPLAASLRHLSLLGSGIDDVSAAILAQSPTLAGLVTLDLSGNSIRAPGVRALADSPHLSALRNLELRGNLIGEDGVRALASSPMAARLRRLSLYKADAWAKGYEALKAAMPPGAQLIIG
jgi:uncharacterized protein (TIGR02996 family)